MSRKIRFPWDDDDWVWPLTFRQGAVITISIIAIIAVLMGITLGGRSAFVSGTSMNPTLKDGDMLYGVRRPAANIIHRGNIIVFNDTDGWSKDSKHLVKRVIAIPGDHVSIDHEGRISVNGTQVKGENAYNAGAGMKGDSDIIIPDGEYWVRGDNVNVSNDSRRIYCYNPGKAYLVNISDILLLATSKTNLAAGTMADSL